MSVFSTKRINSETLKEATEVCDKCKGHGEITKTTFHYPVNIQNIYQCPKCLGTGTINRETEQN